MNQSDSASVEPEGWGPPKWPLKDSAASPDSPVRWNASPTFGSDTAEWCRPSIEYQGCAEMKAIWYSQRGEGGNEIDVVRRMSRWSDAKRKSVEAEKLHSWCFMLKWHSSFNTIWKRLLFLKESGPVTERRRRRTWEGSLAAGTTGLKPRAHTTRTTHLSREAEGLTSWVWRGPGRSSGRSWSASAGCLQTSSLLK